MASNISSSHYPVGDHSQLSHEFRRLPTNYDFFDRQRSRIRFSPPLTSAKYRDHSMPSGTSRPLNIDSSVSYWSILRSINPDLLAKAKHQVNEAIMKKKIFTIYGPYEKVRQVLKSRGWVEKLTDGKAITALYTKLNKMSDINKENVSQSPKDGSNALSKKSAEENVEEDDKLDSIASLLVLNCVSDFIWSLRLAQIDERTLKSNQIINHFKRAGAFTTKIGLIKSFNYLCWYEKNHEDVFPRSYILSDENEKKAFLDDYYLTACMGLIKLTALTKDSIPEQYNGDKFEKDIQVSDINNSKWEINKVKPMINYNAKEVGDSKYKIDKRYPEMAIHYCEFYLKYQTNKDLDQRQVVFCSVKRWEEFFENFQYVTNEGYGIDCNNAIRERSKHLCKELEKIHPQFNLDGSKNVWIIKPGAKSRGRGIFCASKFSDINDVVNTTSETLIVQKYIENPLLVYKTKFDIRQWFLVTNWSPLTIWWYNDSYIRFCSQQFTLNDFNESVHLSNNSIQYKYQNGTRSKNLPMDNMWEWRDFENYLNENGYIDGWKKQILPSMKDIIIDILLCCQEEIEDRKNSFELYGADFMVTADDLKTWLLEINSSPCMAPSTDVTARLTKSVLEDVMKVLLDYPDNVYCDTGQFDLLYKQFPFTRPVVSNAEKLVISGMGIRKPLNFFQPQKKELMSPKRPIMHEDTSILRNKIRQITENLSLYREGSRLPESNKDYRSLEPRMNQLSLDLKNKRLHDYKTQCLEMEQRRTRSHNPEVLNKQGFSLIRNESKKCTMPITLAHSDIDTEMTKDSKTLVRQLQPIRKSMGDETHQLLIQQQKQPKYKENFLRWKTANEEHSLISKLQSWKQMDKSQKYMPMSLQIQRYIS